MTLFSLISAASCIVSAVAEPPVQLNGWHPCQLYSLTPDNSVKGQPDPSYFMETSSSNTAEVKQFQLKQNSTMDVIQYECAKFRLPMCYDDVCESDQIIDVFVKRVVATITPDGRKGKALWIVPGGPGDPSTSMERLVDTMYLKLDREVSVYTFDHRGTGRSARLECQGAQAEGLGSPGGLAIRLDEMPACIDDIRFQVGNQTAAFSVTSAAKDLAAIIDHVHSNEAVFVYAVSYGTYLVERMMHFAPASVLGFVLDGVMSESVAKGSIVSDLDRDTGIVGDRFLAACMADEFCKSKFSDVTDLAAFVHELYDKLDAAVADGKSGTNACADVLAKNDTRPSCFLRSAFGNYIMSDPLRIVIPAVIYRASRCTDQDATALSYFAESYKSFANEAEPDEETLLFQSKMLYYLIVFSEMWESPTPDEATLLKRYETSTMASGMGTLLSYYCLFSGSREHACHKLLTRLPAAQPLVYEHDQYWNKTSKVPGGATALLMTGGMDTQTRRTYGELEYEMMIGERMLLNFNTAGHCALDTTLMNDGGETCGLRILTSYVKENGVLKNVNTSCMDDLKPLNFLDEAVDAHIVFGTDDLYENSVRTLGKARVEKGI